MAKALPGSSSLPLHDTGFAPHSKSCKASSSKRSNLIELPYDALMTMMMMMIMMMTGFTEGPLHSHTTGDAQRSSVLCPSCSGGN